MAKSRFRAAVVQTLAALGDLEHNIGLLQQYTKEAVQQGAELVVFPECMNTGYLFDSLEHCRALAEPLTGSYVSAMQQLCLEYGIHLASGMTELDPDSGQVFNSGILLDDQGQVAIHYQKQFLATHDQNWFEVGVKGSPVADTALGRLGLLICFDGRIPEIARCLTLQGAEVIVDMANFFKLDQADLWGPARAYENGIWLVAATKSGVERSIYYPGGSMIVAPSGQVMVRIPDDTHAVATTEIDCRASAQKTWHGLGDKVQDRRPGSYTTLVKPFAETRLAAWLTQPLIPDQATVKIAAIQSHATSKTGSWGETLQQLEHAAKLGIQLMVLPAHCTHSTWTLTAADAEAQADRTDSYQEQVSAIAVKYGCMIVLPLVQRIASQLMYTAVLIGATGSVIGQYQQVHLDPESRDWAKPGNMLSIVETELGRVGILLGYDGLFPEAARVLALEGADIITWSCAWQHQFERELLSVPKAEDNRVYVVCANRHDCPYPGGSVVIPPTGFPHWDVNVSAPVNRIPGAVMPMYANLALSRQKRIIPNVDVIRNRLVETYAPLVAEDTI